MNITEDRGYSIDAFNNLKGHVKNNIVLLCISCNATKGERAMGGSMDKQNKTSFCSIGKDPIILMQKRWKHKLEKRKYKRYCSNCKEGFNSEIKYVKHNKSKKHKEKISDYNYQCSHI